MRTMQVVVAVALLAVVSGPGRAEDKAQPEGSAKVTALLAGGDSFAAAEYIQGIGPPPEVATAYAEIVMHLYWERKDAPGVVALGRAGILYCLTKGAESADPAGAADWRSRAKAMAYNVGSFTWPGWGEEGVTLTEAEVLAGREAATLNLRLARELGKPAKALSAAHWLVGAHQLAAGEFSAANGSFTTAWEQSDAAEDEKAALMASGYAALSRVLAKEADAEEALAAGIVALKALGTADAKFYARQIATARDALGAWLADRK